MPNLCRQKRGIKSPCPYFARTSLTTRRPAIGPALKALPLLSACRTLPRAPALVADGLTHRQIRIVTGQGFIKTVCDVNIRCPIGAAQQSSGGGMIRLFVGLGLPETVRGHLRLLCGGVPGARWSEPENLHLTLRFIGEVSEDVAQDIDAALAQIHAPAFSLTLTGVGMFGGSKGRQLWAGVADTPALLHLQAKCESALVRIGLAPEGRSFLPHVTLARLKDAPLARVTRFLEEYSLFRAPSFPVSEMVLFASFQGRSGVTYDPVRQYSFV